MSFEKRLCNGNVVYKELNCIMSEVMEIASSTCGCIPSYMDNSTDVPCDTFGTICYENTIENGTQNLDVQNGCYPACRYLKYSMNKAAVNSMDDKALKIERFGTDFSNFFSKMVLQGKVIQVEIFPKESLKIK